MVNPTTTAAMAPANSRVMLDFDMWIYLAIGVR